MLIIADHLFLHIIYNSQGMLTCCNYNMFFKKYIKIIKTISF